MPERPDTYQDRDAVRLWLQIYQTTSLIEQRIRSRLSQEFGVSLARFDLLSALVREDKPMTMGALSRRLLVSNGNVTGLISRLVEDGLVTRNPDPQDRRVMVIELTAQGRRDFTRMAEAHAGWLNEFIGQIDPALTHRLRDDLVALRRSLHPNEDEQADAS
ncbi:MarR family transcriptional regulator [Maricaulis sp.]|uniref:MarR family winged helix-turn-helix transcriptional regulator n=1 Tax=Maricaulis sp. TaxID=1486257 RepID=UPI0026253F1D|nr:MarR family transcriptional regulator [Maricaulis sp.]